MESCLRDSKLQAILDLFRDVNHLTDEDTACFIEKWIYVGIKREIQDAHRRSLIRTAYRDGACISGYEEIEALMEEYDSAYEKKNFLNRP